jgi:hypothetical protein
MKQTLRYGRILWSYEDFDPKVPCRPTPFLSFSPVRINGKVKHLAFSDKVSLHIFLQRGKTKMLFREAYVKWFSEGSWVDRDLGEGRSFLRWMQRNNIAIEWKPHDFDLHPYFLQKNAPKHAPGDELAQGHSFAIKPVTVSDRKVKLYLEDEAVLNLMSLPFGEEQDFLKLVEDYVSSRFQWEKWKAPAPPFLDWIKAKGLRPLFGSGQLGLSL